MCQQTVVNTILQCCQHNITLTNTYFDLKACKVRRPIQATYDVIRI